MELKGEFLSSTVNQHTCAILNDDSLKCWGRNDQGQLGQGDINARGDGSGEMGASLLAVDVGTGLTVKSVSLSYQQTCVVLSDDTAKCWGFNMTGQLGRDDQNAVGWAGGQMGDSLTPINVGAGRTVAHIAAGRNHTCAILDNATVKCWGLNSEGQLGQGNTTNVGDGLGNTMASLNAVSLGGAATALSIAAGDKHTCVILDSAGVKCWGYNSSGQLGQNNTTQIGDGVGPSVAASSVIDLGGSGARTATALAAADFHTCAILDNGSLKCWGYNLNGQLGQGDTNHRGFAANQMGDNLPPIGLGWQRTVLAVGPGGGESTNSHVCAVLDSRRIKCWGLNSSGQLGLGHTQKRGDTDTGKMGDLLPYVDLTP
ncbi:MAG: hypothetical protein IT285_12065 [Bdellovibrionales bacterium]|nr:hypothetical protein [Bdellovibrionales bacterium]